MPPKLFLPKDEAHLSAAAIQLTVVSKQQQLAREVVTRTVFLNAAIQISAMLRKWPLSSGYSGFHLREDVGIEMWTVTIKMEVNLLVFARCSHCV